MRTTLRGPCLASAVLVLLLSLDGKCQVVRDSQPGINSADIAEPGKQLRHDIDEKYEATVATRSLKTDGMGRNPIEGVLARYISTGMPLRQVETLLRSAGFTFRARGKEVASPGRQADYFVIDPYRTSLLASKTMVFVTLFPNDEKTWERLESFSAEFILIYI